MTSLVPVAGQDAEFAELFEHIYTQLATIRLKWRVYRAFYGTNSERVSLLNSISGTTALIIQDALYDDVVLSLCRLADPANSRGKENNSLFRLLTLTEESPDRATFSGMVADFKSACDPLIGQRHRFIAHSDRSARFDKSGSQGVSRLQIEHAIESLRLVVVYMHLKAFGTHVSSEPVSNLGSDEVSFLRTLYYGQQKLEEMRSDILDQAGKTAADPREIPPETRALRDLYEMPEWLNYRPPERMD
ncbi:AbiU2 domain-containing protein [Paracoccus zhejiangensis]|uniref:HEPN AbiU2-like domain-containing protein n=1 Tax=Paracoccus zhejiangensis TaxID=1077935 RepID=A0A2H5EUP9_9RHOB|nr:hypothetical protein [Paracoccus zhejiangensis]AUH63019.1 hypothetical protein CX676_01635 [Paracoccus zhejiangensis]